MIAQEELAIDQLEQSIENIKRAGDRALQRKERLGLMAESGTSVAIGNEKERIREVTDEIERGKRKIEEYRDILDRLAKE